jgi:hypothetical protein
VRGLLLAGALLLVTAPAADAALSLVPAGTYSAPIYATAPRADAESLYVVERGGKIWIRRGGVTLPQPFLDVSGEVDGEGEGGLLSLAFATDYSASGLFYVYLTPNDANPGVAPFAPIQIREYRRSANPDVADPTGRIVLTIPHPDNRNHYGGTLAFGPDGRLYIGTGDGGGAGDAPGNAQNLSSRLGKLLRIDPRQNGPDPYSVPVDNPFAGPATGDDLIWAYGLRNPFRFSFDRATGALTIGDVGQGAAEEIDFAPGPAAGRGLNFGWNTCEGTLTYPGGQACTFGTLPVLNRPHPVGLTALTGGVVVRDPGLPELAGRYLYADFYETPIRSAVLALPAATEDGETGLTAGGLAAFGEDACGRVYPVSLNGAVTRVTDGPPDACTLLPDFPAPPPTVPSAGPPAATTGPSVTLGGSRRQRVLVRRQLSLRVRCGRPCKLRVVGNLVLPGADRRLPTRTRRRSTRTVTIGIPVTKPARRRIRRALRSKRRVLATLTIRARDDANRLTVAKRTIRIVG